jgi:2,4-dienoyl-CoA reductase (NADPH2)
VAEKLLADGDADMISMARPFLADPEFVNKAAAGRAAEINTCIACNQACLDHTFRNELASCLVNPRACHETELNYRPASVKKKVVVVGAGPAGLAAACVLAERGHCVELFDSASEIGGQFNMAKRIPGKEEFHETLRYFHHRLERAGVRVQLDTRVTADHLARADCDEVVLATGVTPRSPRIPGQDHPRVLSYPDVLLHEMPVGKRVAVIGAGGIGFDVGEFLVHDGHSPTLDLAAWQREWGVRFGRGPWGVADVQPDAAPRRGDLSAAENQQAQRRSRQDHRGLPRGVKRVDSPA